MFTLKCHDTAVDQNGMPYTVQARNYLMLSADGQRLYVQNGQVWNGENSPPLSDDQIPDWFYDQIRMQSPDARREVGYLLPEDREKDAEAALERLARDLNVLPETLREKARELFQAPTMVSKAPKTSAQYDDKGEEETPLKIDPKGSRPTSWTCEACNQEIPLRQKGVHKARLSRLGRCV